MTLEIDIAFLDRLPETDPIGNSDVELGSGDCGGSALTCLVMTCFTTSP